MPMLNFDLEDGKPPVSFSLKESDCDRFMEFMAECQKIKSSQTNPTQSSECYCHETSSRNCPVHGNAQETQSSEPVAYMFDDKTPCGINHDEMLDAERFNSFNADTRHHERINIRPLFTHPTPTISAAELGQVLEALKLGEDYSLNQFSRSYGAFADQVQINSRKISAAIALLEKVKP